MGVERRRAIHLGRDLSQELVTSVIEQSIRDYKKLVRLGYIKKRTYSGKKYANSKPFFETYRTAESVADLCRFFWTDQLEEWLFIGSLEVDPGAIRRGLDLFESENHKKGHHAE